MENDKIPSNCTFLSVPKMNSEIFCQIPSQAKGYDVKLQKQQKLLLMASLKIAKTLDSLMVIKESEKLDSVRMSSMKRHATEALAILSHANGSITQTRRNDTMSYPSRDYKQLRSGVPKSSEYLFGDDLNQRVQAITKTSKTIKINLSSNANTDSRYNKRPFPKVNYTLNYQSSTFTKNHKPFPSEQFGPFGKRNQRGACNQTRH